MEFIEIMKQHDLEEAYKILKELEPELNKENFLKSIDHELLKNHKLFLPLKSLAIILVIACTTVFAQTRQEHVHQMAHSVMPFDVSQTIHIFKMTESGGVQRVIAKDPGATDQIALIQSLNEK
jgi:hypothetical protein